MTAPLNLQRLGKLLALIGSSFDAEALAAARAADRLVRDAGLTWPDVLIISDNHRSLTHGSVDNAIDFCTQQLYRLTIWEREFVACIRRQRRPLSARQLNCLYRIVDRLRARAEAA